MCSVSQEDFFLKYCWCKCKLFKLKYNIWTSLKNMVADSNLLQPLEDSYLSKNILPVIKVCNFLICFIFLWATFSIGINYSVLKDPLMVTKTQLKDSYSESGDIVCKFLGLSSENRYLLSIKVCTGFQQISTCYLLWEHTEYKISQTTFQWCTQPTIQQT